VLEKDSQSERFGIHFKDNPEKNCRIIVRKASGTGQI
jgi:hypothetical protein